MSRFVALSAVLAVLSAFSTALMADDVSTDELIRQLDSRQFADRQNASEKLAAKGVTAIDALQTAALNGSREARIRSIDVLKAHFQSSDDALKAAAKTALEKIASSDKVQAARRAKEVLQPKEPPAPAARQQIQLGQIQIQVQGIAQGGRRISVKTVNGVKEINATENGVKVKIIDDPKNGIKIEVKTKKNGKEDVKKYEAKNADELKKKHPDAHKLYEKYSKKNPIQLRFPGRPNIQLVPRQGRFNARPLPNRVKISETLDGMKKQLSESAKKLESIETDSATKEKIEAALKQLKDAQSKLEKLAESLR